MKRKRLQKKIRDAKSTKVETTDPLLEVFSTDSIIHYLEKFLHLADLKNLRLVSRHFNSNVILRTSFTSRVFFTVNQDLISSRTLEKIGFKIKKARIVCFRADSSCIRVCKKCSFVRRIIGDYDGTEMIDGEADAEENITRPLIKIWKAEDVEHIYDALNNVEDLSVHCPNSVFAYSCLCDAKSETAFPLFPSVNRIIQDSRKKLKELKLSSKWLKHVLGDYAGNLGYRLKKLELLQLDGICSQLPESLIALKHIKTVKVGWIRFFKEADSAVIKELIVGNAKSLESLSIKFEKVLDCFSYPNLTKFTQLKHLQIDFKRENTPQLIEFLEGQKRTLETVTLKLECYSVTFPEELLLTLPNLPNLRRLCITASESVAISMEHFSILRSCVDLEYIQIKLKRYVRMDNDNPGIEIPQMFNYLPASARNLSIYGYAAYRGPALLEPGIRTVPNLTALELLDCYAAVTNETLQAIFTNCTILKELVLTHARECNNEGFQGNGSSASTSINNLTRLEKLILQDCNLTDVVVFKAFRFPKLIHLDITQNEALTDSLRLQYLLTRNPALEVLRLNKFHGIDQRDDLIQLRKTFPGLRLLQVKPRTIINPDYTKYVTL